MASRGWGKNKKGVLVNSQGKTALEVRLDKYATKLKARKEKLAAKKAEAKAKASGVGGSGEKGTAKPANKGSEEKLNEIASQYGWSVKDGVLYTSKGDFMHSVTEKKGRIHLRNKDGELRGTLSSPEKLGGYLEKTFYAEKRKPEPPAKPASKGSEEIDPSRYLESNTSKTINTSYRVNKFDIDMVSSRKKAGDFDVEGEARKIASAGGVTTNLPLVAMRQDKKIEVVAGDREFFANKRAQELNPYQDMVSGVFLKSSQIKGALAQKSLFKDHEGDFTVQSGQFSRVDTADIESSIKQPSKKVLDAQVKALLDTGDVGNVIPVILQRVGKKSAVNQKYRVVSGHDSYHAMRELQRRNPNFEMTNAFILD